MSEDGFSKPLSTLCHIVSSELPKSTPFFLFSAVSVLPGLEPGERCGSLKTTED